MLAMGHINIEHAIRVDCACVLLMLQMRMGHLKTKKTVDLSGGSENRPISALAANVKGDALVSGHENGHIYR